MVHLVQGTLAEKTENKFKRRALWTGFYIANTLLGLNKKAKGGADGMSYLGGMGTSRQEGRRL